jgi:hypothetical protein
MPAGATCTGTVAGQSNVCMVKLVNPSNAGVCHSAFPFCMFDSDFSIAVWRMHSGPDGHW